MATLSAMNRSRSRILELPFELRELIYRLLYQDTTVYPRYQAVLLQSKYSEAVQTGSSALYSPDNGFSLLLICRQVYAEGVSTLLSATVYLRHR